MATKSKKNESTAMYTAGLVCGIVGVVLSFIPGISWAGLILGILALTFGIIGLVRKAGGGKAIAATVLGGISVLVGIIVIIIVANTFNAAVNTILTGTSETANSILDTISSYAEDSSDNSNTGNVVSNFLENYDDSALGNTIEATINGYVDHDGLLADKALSVTVKNISDETLSFTVNIEALDSNGNRIDESFVSANDIAPGQSVTDYAFDYSSLDEDILENATFRIYRATSY